MQANEVIELLELEPLGEEGGFFRQTFRSKIKASISLGGEPAHRVVGTAIYYLMTPRDFSALHLVKQDELFHFYLGDPVEQVMFGPEDRVSSRLLGTDLAKGQRPQALVPGGTWQGARLVEGGKWALLGATVCPGYEQADFKLGLRDELIASFPACAETILRFTR